jgi:hypothetical protein
MKCVLVAGKLKLPASETVPLNRQHTHSKLHTALSGSQPTIPDILKLNNFLDIKIFEAIVLTGTTDTSLEWQ